MRVEVLGFVIKSKAEAWEDDRFDYKLEHDERSLRRNAKAREEIRKGQFIRLEDLPD